MTHVEQSDDDETHAYGVRQRPRHVVDAVVFGILVVMLFTLFVRVLMVRAMPSEAVVVVSGASPADGAATVLRAVALDTARERIVDTALTLRVGGRVIAPVFTEARPGGAQRFVVEGAALGGERAEFVVDGAVRTAFSLQQMPLAHVRVRGWPWTRDVQGSREVPIYPLRPRASSFLDTDALVIEGETLRRETLVANAGRIVDAHGRLMPIERSEIDVRLPSVVAPGPVSLELRAPVGAPVHVDVLLVDAAAVTALLADPGEEEMPAHVVTLLDETGQGADRPVTITVPLHASVAPGSLLLVVTKSAPYPLSRGLVFAAIVDDHVAHADLLLTALVVAHLPDDPLVALVGRMPGLIDDDVRRALLSRVSFEPQGLPALGAPVREQMADSARAHDETVARARALFRGVAVAVFVHVVFIGLRLVWRTRRALRTMSIDCDADDDEVPQSDRMPLFAVLAVIGVAAILFGLDAVTRLSV